jgi:hypothetical protein
MSHKTRAPRTPTQHKRRSANMHKSHSAMELWHQSPPNEYAKLAGDVLAICELEGVTEQDMHEMFHIDTTSRKNKAMLKIMQQLVEKANAERNENNTLRKENEALKRFIMQQYIQPEAEPIEAPVIPMISVDSPHKCTIEDDFEVETPDQTPYSVTSADSSFDSWPENKSKMVSYSRSDVGTEPRIDTNSFESYSYSDDY